MDGERFERAVAEMLQSKGFNASLTKKTNDRGIDVVAEKDGAILAVQAKHYSKGNKVGSEAVQKASGLPARSEIDAAIIVTTSSFTSEAQKVAANRGVELMTVDLDAGSRRERKTRSSGSRSSGVNDEFVSDPRVQKHQEEAGVEPVEETDDEQEDAISSETQCQTCNETIPASKSEHIKHWKTCTLPSNRPTHIEVDVWWDIKDEVE